MYLLFTLFVAVCIITETYCDDGDNLVFKYDGMELQKSMDEYFAIEFHEINNKDGHDSIITLNGTVDQKLDLDDYWKSDITVHRSDTVDGEYSEYMKLPKVGICFCMKTMYKKYFYPSVKDCSNLPPPDTCPLPKQKYWINCNFDAKVFKHASEPGFYLIKANLVKDEEIKTGMEVRGSVSVK